MEHKVKIFNTLSGKVEPLKPIKNKKINMFVCGPTVYDFPHLGHSKTYVAFDIFVKFLRSAGYKVFYLQNITNIDDKIIARAREKGVPVKDLADAFEKEYLKGMKALGVSSVNKYAKATSHIKEIISQVQRLEKKGYAYVIEGDGVYYDISKFKRYGKLAGRTVGGAEDGISRVDYSAKKKNRGDFCLWKLRQHENEPTWKSPWGAGRPGWHIEDTAITEKFFGAQYDLHGGGRDLMFPHHEAEISQMEAISGKRPLVKYWMHIGFLTVNGQKMSKSLGNFITIDDFLKRHPANFLRFLVAKNLWSSPMDYSEAAMVEIKTTLDKIYDFLRRLKSIKTAASAKTTAKIIKAFKENFYKELDNNFNTPKAFAVLFEFMKTANQLIDQDQLGKKDAQDIYKFFEEINKFLGVMDFKKAFQKLPEEITRLVESREQARKDKDWAKSDELRAELEKRGYAVEDTKDGPVVKSI